MPRRLRPSLLFAMAAALALTGCRPTATGGVEEKARDTAKVFLQTCASNPLAAFDLLSEPAREDFFKGGTGFQGCRRILGFTPSRKETVRELFRGSRVESVERRGRDQFFTVTVKSPDGERADLDLELQGDRFRIANPPAPSAEEKARDAATELLKACADEDRAKALDVLSDRARTDFLRAPSVLDGCAGILDVKKLPGEKSGEEKLRELFRDARVESLDRSLTDESFKATVEPPEGENLEVELEPDAASDRYLVSISKEDKAREAATELLKACADEDRAKAVDLLSDPARTEFVKGTSVLDGCAEVAGVKELPGTKPREDKLRTLFDGARVETVDPTSPTDEMFKATVKTPAGESLELELEPDPKSDTYLVA